jgi:hypothetical protein
MPLTNPLTAGTTFTVSFNVSGLDSGESLTYTIGSTQRHHYVQRHAYRHLHASLGCGKRR